MRGQDRSGMPGPIGGARSHERGMSSNLDMDGRPAMDHGSGGPGRGGHPYDGLEGPPSGVGSMNDSRMGGPRGGNMGGANSGGGEMPRRDTAFAGGYPDRGGSWGGDGGAGYDAGGDRGTPSGEFQVGLVHSDVGRPIELVAS